MTKKSSIKKLARKMQAETGWSYQACLNKLSNAITQSTDVSVERKSEGVFVVTLEGKP